MNELNQQIAIIDGWKLRYSDTGAGFPDTWTKDGLTVSPLPDYLAPENLHELVRVILKICEDKGLYCGIDLCGKSFNYVTISDPKTGEAVHPPFEPPVTVAKISAALAEAILEADNGTN